MDVVLLSRIRFALTTAVHLVFHALIKSVCDDQEARACHLPV